LGCVATQAVGCDSRDHVLTVFARSTLCSEVLGNLLDAVGRSFNHGLKIVLHKAAQEAESVQLVIKLKKTHNQQD